MVAVLIESIHGAARFGPDRVRNLTDPEIFMPFLLEELIPFVDANWNVSADPAKTILVGQSLGGLAAAHAALTAPYRFGVCGRPVLVVLVAWRRRVAALMAATTLRPCCGVHLS